MRGRPIGSAPTTRLSGSCARSGVAPEWLAPDGDSALNLAAARLRYVAASQWSTRPYLNMQLLREADHAVAWPVLRPPGSLWVHQEDGSHPRSATKVSHPAG
jgi:hypothetical protein